jgi:hypothetical protein
LRALCKAGQDSEHKEWFMKRLAGLLALLMWIAVPLFAQDTQESQESQGAPASQSTPEQPKPHVPPYVPKYEISLTGSYYSFYSPSSRTLGMLGWNGMFQYNFRQWLGLAGEGFGEYYNQGTNGKTSIYSGLAGTQVYPFGHRKVTLFGKALIGEGRYRIAFPSFGGFGFSAVDKSTIVYEVGGGLDYNLKKHWSIRVVQGDYDKADFFTGNANRAGYRISFGAIYRFGQR